MRPHAFVLVLLSALPAQQRGLTPLQVAELQSVTGVYPSPNGTLLAFTRATPRLAAGGPGAATDNTLWVVGADGTEERQLVSRPVGGVAWQPDGSALTYLADGKVMALTMR